MRDHIDTEVLEQKIKQDLYEFNPDAKQMARDSRKVQLERSRCYNTKAWPCMEGKNVKVNPSLVPSMDQTVSVTGVKNNSRIE